jgi:hypothetical protein
MKRMKRKTGSATRPFIGAWDLVSWQLHFADGKVQRPFEGSFVGRVLYDASGQMSAQIMKRSRSEFASGSRLQGTPEEFQQAFEGYVAFFGAFTVDAVAGTVTHCVEGHLSPNQVGTHRIRSYEFKGDRLILKPPPRTFDGVEVQPVLIWCRMRS